MAANEHSTSVFDDEVGPLWKWSLRAIGVLATILGIVFAWVQLREVPLPNIENAEPTHVRRLVLAIYYACWVAGATFDANTQKEVYRRDPQRGSIPREAFLAVIGLFVVAAVLLWASDSDLRTSLALAPFLIVNVIGWRVVVHRITPIIANTTAAYQQVQEYARLEQLNIVKEYMVGRWQWIRFAGMLLIVVTANAICLFPEVRASLSHALHGFAPSLMESAISNLLPVAALASFVLFGEAWIWIRRARCAVALRTIGDLAERYKLQPAKA